jgi:hypothetical protein
VRVPRLPHPGAYAGGTAPSSSIPAPGLLGSRSFGGGSCEGVVVDAVTAQFPGEFSVEGWVNTTQSTGVIFRWRWYGYLLRVDDSRAAFELSTSGSGGGFVGGTVLSGSRVIADGHWHHVAAVRSGNKMQLFVDGILDTETGVGSATNFYGLPREAAIGRDGNACDGAIPSMTGKLAAVALFGRPLSPAEVVSHARAGSLSSVKAKSPILIGSKLNVVAKTDRAGVRVGFFVLGGAASSLGQGACVQPTQVSTGSTCVTAANRATQWGFKPAEPGLEQVRAFLDVNRDGFFQDAEPFQDVSVEVLTKANYGATGDSFATGSLTGGTLILPNAPSNLNRCDQHREAYPVLLSPSWYAGMTIAGPLDTTGDQLFGDSPTAYYVAKSPDFRFYACSGAKVTGPDANSFTGDKQREGLRTTTDLITWQLGRNGTISPVQSQPFGQFFADCFQAFGAPKTSAKCRYFPGAYENEKKDRDRQNDRCC